MDEKAIKRETEALNREATPRAADAPNDGFKGERNMKPKLTDSPLNPTYVALEAGKRGPIPIGPSNDGTRTTTKIALPIDAAVSSKGRKAPPRVRKPDPSLDRCLAPSSDLVAHRARLREAFGRTMSDEFVEVMLGKLVEALRPNPFDRLEEATLNAALALISSVQPRTELEALLAVQIVATGFSGLRFLRQSQHHMDEAFIAVYGGYAMKLLRLEQELIQTLDRHRRGHKQTVEVRHVHLHDGAQGVFGIVNQKEDGGGSR
jgi:hypothetical protein